MEKIVVKETYRSSKPQKENKVEEKKKRSYKPKKQKVETFNLDEELVMRSEEVPHIKTITKQIGSYKIGKSFHIFFEKKPSAFHRFFTKLFLGWKWQDQK